MIKVEIKPRNGWLYLFYYDAGGKRHRESLKLKNTRENMIEARIKKDEKICELADRKLLKKKILIKKKSLLLSQGLEEFKQSKKKVKESTKKTYKNAMDKFIQHAGDITIKSVIPELVEEIEKQILRDKKPNGELISENTVASYMNRLHIIYDYFIEEGYAEINPVPTREINIREIVTIPDDDLIDILTKLKMKNKKHYKVVVFLLLTGLRRGEIIGLTFERNVDFIRKRLKVYNFKKSRIDKIPLWPELEEFLLTEWEKQRGLLFDYKSSQSLKFFEKFLKKEGYENYSFHTLRKTFISKLINSGVNVFDVMKLGRLKNLKTLLKHYSAAELSRMGNEITARTNLGEIVGHKKKKKNSLRLIKGGIRNNQPTALLGHFPVSNSRNM